MNLYVIRHAIAEEENSSKEDSQRVLTEKGSKKMLQIAKGLKKLGVELDLILSSPYLRAAETAEILGGIFKPPMGVLQSDNLLPMGDPELLIAEINEKYQAEAIGIVGHEPYLTALTSILAAQSTPLEIIFKKGGVCRLSADNLRHSRRASLEWILTPGILVELAEK